jgi:hypothetical protein
MTIENVKSDIRFFYMNIFVYKFCHPGKPNTGTAIRAVIDITKSLGGKQS